MRFVKFNLGGPTPDKKKIRLFRNELIATFILRRVMKAFDWQLQKKDYLPMSGPIVGATLVPAPKQRNSDAEKEAFKRLRAPRDLAQQAEQGGPEGDRRPWTLKIGGKIRFDGQRKPLLQIALPVFDYKSHVSIDRRFGFIRECATTSASHVDGRMLPRLVAPDNTSSEIFADSAYRSQKTEKWLASKVLVSCIYRRKPAASCRRQTSPG